MKESLTLRAIFNSSPSAIYEAWLDSEGHSNMIDGDAICSNEEGGKFSAWDGYIVGRNLSLKPNEEIVQSWRTLEFDESDEDSHLIIRLAAVGEGTELTLIHTNIPEGQTQYLQGWKDNYFEPMSDYFN